MQLVSYSRLRGFYPEGMTIAGVSVSGLDPQQASQRLLQVYGLPVEIRYGDEAIHLEPNAAGFELDMESMLAAADYERTGGSFWPGFWDYLWNRQRPPVDIPLISSFSEERLRAYLQEEIAARYDLPAIPAQPIPGTPNFTPGTAGRAMDIDRAILLVEDALRSPSSRAVSVTFERTVAGRPTLQSLQTQILQVVDASGFDGIIGIYLRDLQNNDNIHLLYSNGQRYPVDPDLAFTASSTIKIPILVTTYARLGPVMSPTEAEAILNMITKSQNPPSDDLMRELDQVRGPLIVTETMQTLGLENTFLAGYFYIGADLLQVFRTPANQRADYSTDPDFYNQTTPSDMGLLLEDVYECSETGGGALVAAFGGKIDQQACKEMIDYLKADRIGVLIEAGVPDGTQVAHKHGWVSDAVFGTTQNLSDAAIVYTPGGNYVLTIYMYHPVNVIWETASRLVAQLSQASYSYFNPPTQ
jgi:beta-lactamase class A